MQDDETLEMTWHLTHAQRDCLLEPGIDADTRLRRALQVVEHAWLGDGSEGPVRVDLALSMDEHERTWPDARTSCVEPWDGHGDVDRANADARRWSARFLLRGLGVERNYH
jgi:hypothetical protein